MKQTPEQILESAFLGPLSASSENKASLQDMPSYRDVLGFAKLIAADPSEEAIHSYIRSKPRLLRGMFGIADDAVLAVISKPKIGNMYVADFGLLWFGQGGCVYSLIELEPANAPLFTRTLSPARRYQSAITQVHEWAEWINVNQPTFIRDAVTTAKELPLWTPTCTTGRFRTRDTKAIEDMWRGFSGYTNPRVTYSIVIGRWTSLSEKQRARLISVNQQTQLYATWTYDEMIRRGIARRFLRW